MSKVPAEEAPLLLHTIPESAASLAEKCRMPAEAAVLTREAVVDLY